MKSRRPLSPPPVLSSLFFFFPSRVSGKGPGKKSGWAGAFPGCVPGPVSHTSLLARLLPGSPPMTPSPLWSSGPGPKLIYAVSKQQAFLPLCLCPCCDLSLECPPLLPWTTPSPPNSRSRLTSPVTPQYLLSPGAPEVAPSPDRAPR